jgi:hypothetical protein
MRTGAAGPDWLHEVKCDGYRMMLIREQGRVRLISRVGHDWARRFPLIVTAALKLRPGAFRDRRRDGRAWLRRFNRGGVVKLTQYTPGTSRAVRTM